MTATVCNLNTLAQERPTRESWLLWAVVGSASLHFTALFLAPGYLHVPNLERLHELEFLDVVPKEQTQARKGTVIDTEDAGNRIRPKESRHFAKHDQTVQKEQASRRARTMPAQSAGGGQVLSRDLSLSDLGFNSKEIFDHAARGPLGRAGEVSMSDDHLPEVGHGDRTLLSAQQYAHWMFITRMKRKLAPIWKKDVHKKVNALHLTGRRLTQKEYIVRVEAILNSEGKLVNSSLKETSGMKSIDAAALMAFTHASPFPNPPDQLLAQDGHLQIQWKFVLREGSTEIIFNTEKKDAMSRRNL